METTNLLTFEDLKKDKEIRAYIFESDKMLTAMGYTEHSFAHVVKCAESAAEILTHLGYDERTVELAKIAAYLHDIGNLVNRQNHAQSSALMAFTLLTARGMNAKEVAKIVAAIGNHDESSSFPSTPISAALVLADKSDVRRSRVRHNSPVDYDIHDRVNYAVTRSALSLGQGNIHLEIAIDSELCPVMDYFRIFTDRMLLCRQAAETLGQTFSLTVNHLRFL